MKYREILELYKEGKLSAEEAEKVEQEIEKQEAIEEFRYSRYEAKESFDKISSIITNTIEDDSDEITDEVGKRIKIAFRKRTAVTVLCIVVIVALFQWVLPSATNVFWYNPSKEVELENYTTDQLSKDMRVYSELFLTTGHFTSAHVESEGYGRYSFELYANGSPYGTKIVAGEINRGRITAYLPEWIAIAYANAFEWMYNSAKEGQKLSEMDLDLSTQYYETREDNIKDLKALASDENHFAFISFDSLMTYDEAVALAKHIGDENAWVAIYCGDESYVDNTNNLGMYINYDVNSSKTPEEYFVSMIKYMQDNNKFAEMWIDGGIDTVLDVSKTLDYIDANGLKSYGIAVYTDRDTLLNLMENPNIFRIMPDRGRFDDIAYRS